MLSIEPGVKLGNTNKGRSGLHFLQKLQNLPLKFQDPQIWSELQTLHDQDRVWDFKGHGGLGAEWDM
jgi:hypothetical protein